MLVAAALFDSDYCDAQTQTDHKQYDNSNPVIHKVSRWRLRGALASDLSRGLRLIIQRGHLHWRHEDSARGSGNDAAKRDPFSAGPAAAVYL